MKIFLRKQRLEKCFAPFFPQKFFLPTTVRHGSLPSAREEESCRVSVCNTRWYDFFDTLIYYLINKFLVVMVRRRGNMDVAMRDEVCAARCTEVRFIGIPMNQYVHYAGLLITNFVLVS